MNNKIYEKYKIELDAVNKYINNKFIYDIFYNYGFTINNKIVPLHSNINIYEACFISQLVNIYINKYFNKELNILEIGLAYGTSSLVIINKILKYKTNYDIVDPNQTSQWKNIGIKKINNFLDFMNKKLNYQLYQESSTTVFDKLNKNYDISFIDGSHDEKIVIQDLMNSDKVLKPNGLIIIDDVLHIGVKNAILKFCNKFHNYKRISIYNNDFIIENNIYNIKEKKSFNNPSTMYCFQKISKKIAFLFLTIENPNFTKVWDKYFEGNQDKINIYIHPKYSEKATWHQECIIENLKETKWGCIVNAYKSLFKEAIKNKDNFKFITVSESCLPIKPFIEMYNDLIKDDKSLIKLLPIKNYDWNARISNEIINNIGKKNIIKHYARMCLSRHHIKKILYNEKKLNLFIKMHVGDEFFLSSITPLHNFNNFSVTFDDWGFVEKEKKKIKNMKDYYENKELQEKYNNIAKNPKNIIIVSKEDLQNMKTTKSYFYRKFDKNSDIEIYIYKFITKNS